MKARRWRWAQPPYTSCTARVPSDAAVGTYPLVASSVYASGPHGEVVAIIAADGAIVVSATPTVTSTAGGGRGSEGGQVGTGSGSWACVALAAAALLQGWRGRCRARWS